MGFGQFARFSVVFLLFETCLTLETVESAQPVEVAGAKVGFVDYQGPATVSVKATGKHGLQIDVDPRSERESLKLGIELPISGRNAWPAADIEMLDSEGRAMSVRHIGIEWHKLLTTSISTTHSMHRLVPWAWTTCTATVSLRLAST